MWSSATACEGAAAVATSCDPPGARGGQKRPLPRGAARWCARASSPALFCGVWEDVGRKT